jgi:hypothetical protein
MRLGPGIEKFSAHVPATVGDGDIGFAHADISAKAATTRRM